MFIDVDGTLVGSSGGVLPAVWTAADQARTAGIRLAICSGRPGFGVTRAYAERLDPSGWHVFQAGASVVYLPTGQSRSAHLLPSTIATLVARARGLGRVLELYTDTSYEVESAADLARGHAEILGVSFAPHPFRSPPGAIVRAQWIVMRGDLAATLAEPHPGLEVSSATSPLMPEAVFINLTATGVSKASAVRAVAEAYGAPLSDVMYVGDGQNDIGAMKLVGFPVAMGNADEDVRLAARLVVGHVDDGGLVSAFDAACSP